MKNVKTKTNEIGNDDIMQTTAADEKLSIKERFLFGILFVLLDLLFVSVPILSVMLYDYFSGRELIEFYQNEYGSTLILCGLFAISTTICAVLFVAGYFIRKNMPKIRAAWAEAENSAEDEKKYAFSDALKRENYDYFFYYARSND